MKPLQTVRRFGAWPGMLIFCWSLAGCGLALDEQDHLKRAQEYADLGDNRAAIIELKNVLQDNPQSIEGRLMLGKVSLAAGDAAGAESAFAKAIELGAPESEVRQLLAQARLRQGNFQAALDQLQDAGNDAETSMLRGYAYQGLGNAAAARAAFESALNAKPDHAETLLGLARVELADGKREAAVALVSRARASAPDDYEVVMLAGRLAYTGDESQAAEADFKRATELAQSRQRKDQEFGARAALAELYLDGDRIDDAAREASALLKIAPNHPIAHFVSARVAMVNEDLAAAEGYLQEVLIRLPDHQPSKLMLGSINLSQGKPAQAEMYLGSVVAADSNNQAARMMLASARVQQGQSDSALNALQPALESEPSDSRVLGLMGAAALQSGDLSKGIEYFEKSLASDPDNPDFAVNLARAYLADGQNIKAIDLLRGLKPVDDKELLRETLLVLALLQEKDSAGARGEAESLLKRAPKLANAWNLAGGVYQATGDIPKAREYFGRSSKLDPKYVPALSNLARLDVAQGDTESAKGHYQKILQVEPANVSAMMALSQIAAKAGEQDAAISWLTKAREASAEAVAPRILLARFYLQSGQMQQADEVSREAFKLAPNNADVLIVRGNLMMAQGNAKEAREQFAKAAAAAPKAAEAQFLLGASSLASGETGGARKALERALELDAGHFRSAALLSSLDMNEGDAGSALSRIARMQALYPERAAPFAAEGDLRMMQEDYATAARAYDAAWEIEASLAVANKIMVARSRARLPDASGPLQSWAADHPDDLAAQLSLGQSYQGEGKNADAIKAYEVVVAAKPGNALALNNLAWLYFLQDDPRALATAEKAREAAPKAGSVTDTLGWILFKGGDSKRALAMLQEAAKQEPGNLDIQYHLAAVLAATGKKSEARKTLKTILDSGKEFGSRSEAQALLETI